MKKRTLMKKVCVFTMLCALTMTMFVQPTFAAQPEPTYKVYDGNDSVGKSVSAERQNSCKRMYEMSQMQWELTERLRYCFGVTSTGALNPDTNIDLYVWRDNDKTKGKVTREGIPYTQVDREHSFPNGFTLTFGTKTIPIGNYTYYSVWGTDCASSIDYAWRKGLNKLNGDYLRTTNTANELYRTRHMFNDGLVGQKESGTNGDYLKLVGSYGSLSDSVRREMKSTKEIVEALMNGEYYGAGKDIYSEIYAAMKPGDAILKRGTSSGSGHVRLVTEVHIKRYADGSVNPNESYVKCIEQAGFRKDNDTKIVSNWSTSWIPNNEKIPEGKFAGQEFTGIYKFTQLTGEEVTPRVNGADQKMYYLPIKPRLFTD